MNLHGVVVLLATLASVSFQQVPAIVERHVPDEAVQSVGFPGPERPAVGEQFHLVEVAVNLHGCGTGCLPLPEAASGLVPVRRDHSRLAICNTGSRLRLAW